MGRWGEKVVKAIRDLFRYMDSFQTYQAFPERATKLTSTMDILIFVIALIVAVNDFVISISVAGLVSISNLDTGSDVPGPVLTGIPITFRVSASIDTFIRTPIDRLALTQSMPSELPQ